MREAVVIKNAGSHYLLSELPRWKPFPAVLRGKVRLKGSTATNPVAVGDRVTYEMPDQVGHDGNAGRTGGSTGVIAGSTGVIAGSDRQSPAVITAILPRRNYFIRKSTNLSREAHIIAANLDQAVIGVSLFFPEIKLPFLDRMLVTCEVYGVPAVIVLNKVDLYREDAADYVADFKRIYEGAGYRVIETSCLTGEGIDELRDLCAGKLSLFSGESGVGKSSLIKALDPSLDPKIGKISTAHLQGKHTTSLYEMYPLNLSVSGSQRVPEAVPGAQTTPEAPVAEAFLIDSPGLRGFGLVDLEPEEIAKYFPEMLRASAGCRFTPCTHTHEPGCAVKEAVDAGIISAERYNSYLGMLEDDGKFRK